MVDKIYIVGLGPGAREYILPKAVQVLEKSDVVIGFSRAVESINFIKTEKQIVKTLSEINRLINENEGVLSIVASGDPCFYGITNYIKNNFQGNIDIISGISSFQYFMSKLCKPWNNAKLGSMHGREEEFIPNVLENELSIWLTDKKFTPNILCEILHENKINCVVYVGENLSYDNEKITNGYPKELMEKEFLSLSVVVVERRS